MLPSSESVNTLNVLDDDQEGWVYFRFQRGSFEGDIRYGSMNVQLGVDAFSEASDATLRTPIKSKKSPTDDSTAHPSLRNSSKLSLYKLRFTFIVVTTPQLSDNAVRWDRSPIDKR